MRVRLKQNGDIGYILRLNTFALAEAIVGFEDGECDSCFYSSLDVLLPNDGWKDLCEAIKDHDVITDNYNTQLYFPQNEEDRKRGYTL
jgi:hypothetical protein